MYTWVILQFINDPFFERIILSNQWDKEKKRMTVDPQCCHKMFIGSQGDLVFNYFDKGETSTSSKPFISAKDSY